MVCFFFIELYVKRKGDSVYEFYKLLRLNNFYDILNEKNWSCLRRGRVSIVVI